MKKYIDIRNGQVLQLIDLPNGTYEINIKCQEDEEIRKMQKKIWGVIQDINDYLWPYKTKEQVYAVILGKVCHTYLTPINENIADSLVRKNGQITIIDKTIINHKPFAICQISEKSMSDMTIDELNQMYITAKEIKEKIYGKPN